MPIVSGQFALLVLLGLFVYYALPLSWRSRWLLLLSLVFYASWSLWFVAILLTIVLVNCWLGRIVSDSKIWLWTGIGLNVFSLISLKYFPKWFDGADWALSLLFPIGFSFIVLQAIAYLVDVYRGQAEPVQQLDLFILSFVYFPKLTSGPIERTQVFLKKVAQPQVLDNNLLAQGITLVVLGIVRKVVFADILYAMIPDDVWETPDNYGIAFLGLWLLALSFSLYNDFAGYTNIVRGVSLLFGIELKQNFALPYFSRNFTEFWNRWHISLSHWLRDYIYFPVARWLRKDYRDVKWLHIVVPPMITMLVSGLWHGLSAQMLVWGGLHGLYQVIERLPSLWKGLKPPDQWPVWQQITGMGLTFGLTMLAWLPFYFELPVALAYVKGLLNFSNLGEINWRIFIILIPAILLDSLQARAKDELFVLRWKPVAQAALLAFVMLVVFFVLQADARPSFVYQGF